MARIAPLNIDWKPDRTTGEPVTEQIVGYMCEPVPYTHLTLPTMVRV